MNTEYKNSNHKVKCAHIGYRDHYGLIMEIFVFIESSSYEKGKATRTSFTSDPQMTSQNGICGMRLPLCRPTLNRFAFQQNFLICICSL